jgi:DegV family protein with EDD domain
MGRVKVVTDSSCDMDASLLDALNIGVVSLKIRFGDSEELVDRTELTVEQFWDRVANKKELPATAAPSPGDFEVAFRAAAAEGYDGVVCITISSKLSATIQAAELGAEGVKDVIDVRVIDSQALSVTAGILVQAAGRIAAEGVALDEVVARVSELRPRLAMYGTLDTLEYLKRGGRLSSARALFGTLLAIKPILVLRDGEVVEGGKERTRGKALAQMASKVTAQPVDRVIVGHFAANDLDDFLAMISDHVPEGGIEVSRVGPVAGTHGGPGMITVGFLLPQ